MLRIPRGFLPCILMAVLAVGFAGATEPHTIVPEDYFDLATIGEIAVSPDGNHVAYVIGGWGAETRTSDLWLTSLADGTSRRLTFDGVAPSSLEWCPSGQWIYFLGHDPHPRSDTPPYDGSTQLWRMAPDGSKPIAVTRVVDGIQHVDLDTTGQRVVYTTSEDVTLGEFSDLKKELADLEYGHGTTHHHAIWELDLTTWRTRQLREATNVIHSMELSPDGTRLALITTDDTELIFLEGWSTVQTFELATGTTHTVTPDGWRDDHPSPYGWLAHPRWASDGAALALTISFDGYPSEIVIAEWDEPQETPSLWTVTRAKERHVSGGPTWRDGSRTLYYLAEDRARTRLVMVDAVRAGSQGDTQVVTPGDVVVSGFGLTPSGGAVTAAATPTRFVDLYTVGTNGLDQRVTDVNPQVADWTLPQLEIFTWTGADGDTVEGILELPADWKPADGPLPLVVELHGGPTSATHFAPRLWIYGRTLLASRGYALLSPNYHGSTGYGDLFMTKLIGRENSIEVTDIRAGVEALVERGVADVHRVGVMGWSNGGFLTNAMITSEPDLFQAASSGAGVLDQLLQWATEDTPGHVINFMQGLPWQVPEAYQAGSPVYQLDRVRTPTLIHVGGSDPRVPPAHSRALYRALRHYLDVPVELVVYPGEGHGLSTRANRLAKVRWDLAWFERYLPVEPAPSE